MRRITVSLPDDIADLLVDEARRLRRTVSEVVREAVSRQLAVDGTGRRELPFANVGSSGHRDGSRRVDEILAEEWVDGYDRGR